MFDERGMFERTIGREGDGPGELRNIVEIAFVDEDRLLVLDYPRRTWITFRETGELVTETRMNDLAPGRFRLVEGDTTAVVATMGRRPESAGYPLHLIDTRDGTVLNHFGATNPTWSIAEPYAGHVNLGEAGAVGEGVWWSKVGRPHIEQWSVDGSLLRSIAGDLEWFPVEPVRPRREPSTPPAVAMTGLAVDGQDRLWMLTVVPGARWREVSREGPEGVISRDQADNYQDTRLDVFDLTTRRHLGYTTWGSPNALLVSRGGTVLVSLVEYETPTWPRAVLYEIDISP